MSFIMQLIYKNKILFILFHLDLRNKNSVIQKSKLLFFLCHPILIIDVSTWVLHFESLMISRLLSYFLQYISPIKWSTHYTNIN